MLNTQLRRAGTRPDRQEAGRGRERSDDFRAQLTDGE
jgi:hypothetical protein